MSAMKIEIGQLNKRNDERLKKEISSQLEFIMEYLLAEKTNGAKRNPLADSKLTAMNKTAFERLSPKF